MISRTKKCIFVHIPRTGGTSLECLIWPGPRSIDDLWMGFSSEFANKYQTGGLQHLKATHIRKEVGPELFHACFRFAFVRNPWDRAVSSYCYLKQRRPDLRRFLGMDERATFAEYLALIRRKSHVQWEPQHSFLTDDTGRLLVDFIGRYEQYEIDARRVADRIGIAWTGLSRLQNTVHRTYQEYYDSETKECVRDMYRVDIEMFTYAFENAKAGAPESGGVS